LTDQKLAVVLQEKNLTPGELKETILQIKGAAFEPPQKPLNLNFIKESAQRLSQEILTLRA